MSPKNAIGEFALSIVGSTIGTLIALFMILAIVKWPI